MGDRWNDNGQRWNPSQGPGREGPGAAYSGNRSQGGDPASVYQERSFQPEGEGGDHDPSRGRYAHERGRDGPGEGRGPSYGAEAFGGQSYGAPRHGGPAYGPGGQGPYGQGPQGSQRVFGERETGVDYTRGQGGYGQSADYGQRGYAPGGYGAGPYGAGYGADIAGNRQRPPYGQGAYRGDGYPSDPTAQDWGRPGPARGQEPEPPRRRFASGYGDETAWSYGGGAVTRGGGDYQGPSHRGRGPKGYQRSDERIQEDANDRLTDDHGVDASDITVNVVAGELTLIGTVDSREAKRRAEHCVEDIAGVKHVQNNLRVQERTAVPPTAATSPAGHSVLGAQTDGKPGDTHEEHGQANLSATGAATAPRN